MTANTAKLTHAPTAEAHARRGRGRQIALAAAAVALLAAVGIGAAVWAAGGAAEGPGKHGPTFKVAQGPMTISVSVAGTIKSRKQEIIKSEVEGQTVLLYLVPEGTQVKQGDLLAELDASRLLDQRVDQQIKVQNGEASFVRARENLEVVRNQAAADIAKAELDDRFAREDLRKYVEGEYPKELKEAESRITVAEEELQRAQERLTWSRRLHEEKYLSLSEMQADELAANRSALDVELAKGARDLLVNFTYQRKLAELESDVEQMAMALERVRRKAAADVVQAEAELQARQSELEREKVRLTKLDEQIAKAKIVAPMDGLVVYATSVQGGRGTEPLAEGQSVRERQDLIYLPAAGSAMAEVKIHESSLEKVRVGLPVVVTVDALPGRSFRGRVAQIAPLPDNQSFWMNPDLKVYTTEIHIEGETPELRTGMSCRAEIIVERHAEALYVPMQAVVRVGNQPQVMVARGDRAEPRPVEIGLDNNSMVRIVSGLEPGEVVLMNPPLERGAVALGDEEAAMGGEDAGTGGGAQGAGGGGAQTAGERGQRGPGGREGRGSAPGGDAGNARGGGPAMAPGVAPGAAPGGGGPGPGAGMGMGGGGRPQLTPEQMAEMRQRFESMSPEERERLREQWMQRRQQQGGEGGGRGGRGGGDAGAAGDTAGGESAGTSGGGDTSGGAQ